MGAQRVVRHELLGHLLCQRGIQAPAHINAGQLAHLGGGVGGQFAALALKVGFFGAGLRVHRHVFARRHRHGPGHQPGHRRHQNGGLAGLRRRHAQGLHTDMRRRTIAMLEAPNPAPGWLVWPLATARHGGGSHDPHGVEAGSCVAGALRWGHGAGARAHSRTALPTSSFTSKTPRRCTSRAHPHRHHWPACAHRHFCLRCNPL